MIWHSWLPRPQFFLEIYNCKWPAPRNKSQLGPVRGASERTGKILGVSTRFLIPCRVTITSTYTMCTEKNVAEFFSVHRDISFHNNKFEKITVHTNIRSGVQVFCLHFVDVLYGRFRTKSQIFMKLRNKIRLGVFGKAGFQNYEIWK